MRRCRGRQGLELVGEALLQLGIAAPQQRKVISLVADSDTQTDGQQLASATFTAFGRPEWLVMAPDLVIGATASCDGRAAAGLWAASLASGVLPCGPIRDSTARG